MNPKKQSKKQQKYKTLEQLGSGAYGTVYKAELSNPQGHQETEHKFYAIKKIKLLHPQEGMPSTALREIAILQVLRYHQNVVDLHQVIAQNEQLTLVFEHLECDLKKFMSAIPKDKGMDPQLIKSLCYQLIKGVGYCHSKTILHRDLKPQNLLISKDNVLKIADFGLARGYGIPNKGLTYEVVTLWYRAPDVLLQSKQYGTQIDIWSIGCILAEMANLRALFTGSNQRQQIESIFRFFGVLPQEDYEYCRKLPGWQKHGQLIDNIKQEEQMNLQRQQYYFQKLGKHGNDLLRKMLQIDPSQRISASAALQHPYFQDLSEQTKKIYLKPKIK